MKDYVWNSLFLAVLGANTYFLWVGDWGLASSLMIVAQSLMIIGLVEMLHQAIHNNFFPNRMLNYIFGVVSGFILGTNFVSYRELHKQHHLYTNTRRDPEQDFYHGETGKLTTLLIIPFIISRNVRIINAAVNILPSGQRVYYWLNNIALLLVVGLFIAALYFYTEEIARVYLLPLVVFYYFEFFMAHSQHFDSKYFDKERPTLVEQSEVSTDLMLPYPIGFLVMFSNYHGTHHRAQLTKWYETPGVAEQFPETRRWTVGQFLGLWWSKGRRTWDLKWRRETGI